MRRQDFQPQNPTRSGPRPSPSGGRQGAVRDCPCCSWDPEQLLTSSSLNGRGFTEGADECPLPKLDFECVMVMRDGFLKCGLRSRMQHRVVQLLSHQALLGLMCPPWHGRDSAECDAGLPHAAPLEIEGDRGRSECEFIRFPVPYLKKQRPAR